MPEFETHTWDAVDAHQAALNHYGIKTSGMHDMPAPRRDASALRSSVRLTEGTGMPVPKRKAVPNAKSSAQTQPRAPVPSSLPAPVPASAPPVRVSSKFVEDSMPTDPKPAKPANPVPGSQPSRSQSPNSEIKRIFRTDGKFDPTTIRAAGDQKPAERYTPPASPSRAPARPVTPTSSRPRVTRSDSTTSTSSWRARRDSMSKLARRMSDAFKDTFDIVKMDKRDRRDYVRNKYDEDERDRSRDSGSRSDVRASSPLDPRERRSQPTPQPSDDSDFEGRPRPGNLSKGEKFAIGVSKAVDPLKPRGRSSTNDSDMSFGMTDLAPPGAMQECAECLKPTNEYLIKGLCKDCHNLEMKILKRSQEHLSHRKEDSPGFLTDPWQFPQGRATWPDVRSPEHGYMKLPRQKKILRIRQTIYEDPGNPFAEELEPSNASLDSSTSNHEPYPRLPHAQEESYTDPGSFDMGPYAVGMGLTVPSTPNNSAAHPEAMCMPMERRGSASTIIRAHRRSSSVAVPLGTPSEKVEEYVAPRTLWRRGSMPTGGLPRHKESTSEGARDTKFYGFYDDIMEDYKVRESRI